MKKNTLKSIAFVALFLLFIGCDDAGNTKQKTTGFDVVILNGRVMDPETDFDEIRNVGIKDGQIEIITLENISGKDTIDATGHVVAPGFIDIHSHISDVPFGQKISLRDGVTTPLDMEAGAYPVDSWYGKLEGKSQTNYGATVSAAGIREQMANPHYDTKTSSVLLDAFDPHSCSHLDMHFTSWRPNDAEIDTMEQMMEEGLSQGAIGIGAVTGYMTKGTTSRETMMWQRLMGKHNLATVLHGRFSSQNPPATGILGTQEMLASQAAYGGGLYVCHIHQQALNLTPYILDLVETCREKGQDAVAAIYPYWQGSTIAGADYLKPENYQENMGRHFDDIIEVATMKHLTKERYEELMKTNPGTSVIFGGVEEQVMLKALADPRTMVESDAVPLTITATGNLALDWDTPYENLQGHPRGAGTHAKVLRLVREQNLMPLMLAISKMSYMQAQFLEDNGLDVMATKGRIQEGMDADITIFHPDQVKDNATFEQGGLPSTGIPYVLVNGTIIVKDSKVQKGVYPGKPIKSVY
ncbi:amidohydrolase family protein [Flammeovirga sp. SJP92]|uniref:amidohydrolase family protein n=1 Tax=Flammeovirga sp. SJP92 TaxID=1775430 RepID=UPI000786E812|nr:amidohydrolase family protein [Flammeovirga sp. SJP92]KXX67621.1 hypothetical protein AVL50_26535 [Flammeovirga sp. SJP92]